LYQSENQIGADNQQERIIMESDIYSPDHYLNTLEGMADIRTKMQRILGEQYSETLRQRLEEKYKGRNFDLNASLINLESSINTKGVNENRKRDLISEWISKEA
jgi:hypothetical protein